MSRTRSRRDRRTEPDRQSAAAVCPECGAEFVAGVETCSDCHIGLVAPTAVGKRLPSFEGLIRVGETLSADVARPLATALSGAGLDHHMAPIEASQGDQPVFVFEPFLRPEDAGRTREIIAEISARPGVQLATPEEQSEEFDMAPTDAPRLRDFELVEPEYFGTDEPATSAHGLLHFAAIPLWLGAVYWAGLVPRDGIGPAMLGVVCALIAAGLHVYARTHEQAVQRKAESSAEAKRQEAESKDWDAIEDEHDRELETFERTWQEEPEPDDSARLGPEVEAAE